MKFLQPPTKTGGPRVSTKEHVLSRTFPRLGRTVKVRKQSQYLYPKHPSTWTAGRSQFIRKEQTSRSNSTCSYRYYTTLRCSERPGTLSSIEKVCRRNRTVWKSKTVTQSTILNYKSLIVHDLGQRDLNTERQITTNLFMGNITLNTVVTLRYWFCEDPNFFFSCHIHSNDTGLTNTEKL